MREAGADQAADATGTHHGYLHRALGVRCEE
jgi:hypothetical protein